MKTKIEYVTKTKNLIAYAISINYYCNTHIIHETV